MAELLLEASTDVAPEPIRYSEDGLKAVLSPRRFVEVRRTHGGPAPVETARAAAQSLDALRADERWTAAAVSALADADRQLLARSREL
jgi:hypothetical protein